MRYGRGYTKPPAGVPVALGHPLARGLVGCWPISEGAGIWLNDLSSNRNPGTISGALWGAGRAGHALSLNGSSDYVAASAVTGISNLSTYTIVSLVKRNNAGATHCLFGESASVSVNYDFLGFSIVATNFLSLQHRSDTGSAQNDSLVCDTAITDTNWHHIAGVRESNTVMKGYLDGQLDGTKTNAGANSLFSTADLTVIGAIDAGPGGLINYFDGLVGHVYVYDRALSAVEINWLYRESYCFMK